MAFVQPDLNAWYEKDPKLKREDVNKLKEWCETQPHLPDIVEMQLIWFLHSCYYDLELAKTSIDSYFTAKTDIPEIFDFASASEELVSSMMKRAFTGPMPKRTQDDAAIFLLKLFDPKPEVYDHNNLSKVHMMLFHLYLKDTGCPDGGMITIYDCKGFSLGHLLRTPMAVSRKMTQFSQNSMPIRIKNVHFVNHTPFVQKLVRLLKPFVEKKLLNMLKFHSTMEDLYKDIPKELLPTDLGGSLPSCEQLQEDNKARILANMDFFQWMDTQKVDENKRPPSHEESTYFGTIWNKLSFKS